MGDVSMTDLERAFQDLYKAIRLSSWDFIYNIDGTAEVKANAVAELAEKRQSKEYIKKDDILKALEKEREYLLSMNMGGAEHILVKHAINVIEELFSEPPKGE